jgi:hypothetical protein
MINVGVVGGKKVMHMYMFEMDEITLAMENWYIWEIVHNL